MNFVKLNLVRDKINSSIKSFDENSIVQEVKKDNNFFIYTIKINDADIASLNVYFNNDGTTTLMAKTGKNHALSEVIASHVVTNCEVTNIPLKPLYIKKISEPDFETLLEFLKDSNVKIEDGKNLNRGKQFKATSPHGDYVLLNKFDSGSFQVQGSNKIIKAWVIECLSDLLPYKDVIDIQLKELDVNVSSDQVISQLEQVLPDAFAFLGSKLKAIIGPAIALQSVNIDLTDYSAFVFPGFKGLEGYIKKLFADNGVVIGNENFGNFLTGEEPPTLNLTTRSIINNNKICKAIEDSYSYYKRQRHGLFHTDGTVETSRIIETRREADGILAEIFDVIQKTYSTIA